MCLVLYLYGGAAPPLINFADYGQSDINTVYMSGVSIDSSSFIAGSFYTGCIIAIP